MSENDSLIEELRQHMHEAGELVDVDGGEEFAEPEPVLDGELVFEQKMKLAGRDGTNELFLVPSDEDWMHDYLGTSKAIAGTFYAGDEPFLSGSATASGYFQADDDERWVRISAGKAEMSGDSVAWANALEDFPEVVQQLADAMEVSEYRHVAEQAAMKNLVSLS